jgi:hydroxyacylglutathione hydrolase
VYTKSDGAKMDVFDKADFISHPDKYTIIDIRSEEEFEQNSFFQTALNFPLNKLQDEAHNIPTDKPIVVHCATGYRSTIGSSIIFQHIKNQQVFDMGAAIKDFSKKE